MPSPPIRFGHEPDARLHAMRLVATILFLFFYIPTWGYLSELVTGGGGVWVMIGLLSFVAILVHELGHAVAARWAGARVINIVAISFELRLRPLRLSWASTAPGRDIGGYVTYTFDDELETRREALIIAAAGPAGEFCAGAYRHTVRLLVPVFGWSDLPQLIVQPGPPAVHTMGPPNGLLSTSGREAGFFPHDRPPSMRNGAWRRRW